MRNPLDPVVVFWQPNPGKLPIRTGKVTGYVYDTAHVKTADGHTHTVPTKQLRYA